VPPRTAPRPRRSPLARYSLAALAILIVYASLHPFHGWAARGAGPFAYLQAAMPKYVSGFDVTVNLVGYAAFGFLVVAALQPVRHQIWAALLATLASAALSAGMEGLQTWLPNRVASSLDLALNTAGGFVGALAGATLAPRLVADSTVRRWRRRWFVRGSRTDVGLVIIALWWLTQLNPETLVFGTGSLRDMMSAVPATLHDADLFVSAETLTTAAHTVAAGLFIGLLVRTEKPALVIVVLAMAVALALRTLAFATLFGPDNMSRWVTAGAIQGLIAGLVVLILASRLHRSGRLVLACVTLMAATALVNIVPANPYTIHALQTWHQGHFLNFNGLTGFVSMLWPFVALVHALGMIGRDRADAAGPSSISMEPPSTRPSAPVKRFRGSEHD